MQTKQWRNRAWPKEMRYSMTPSSLTQIHTKCTQNAHKMHTKYCFKKRAWPKQMRRSMTASSFNMDSEPNPRGTGNMHIKFTQMAHKILKGKKNRA